MAPDPQRAPRQRWRRRSLLAVTAIVVAVLIVEVGLRTIGGVFHDRFTMPDAERGWVLRPGFAGWMSEERTLWVRINRDGLRDREHPLAVPERTVRIAMLGDSYTQGINVPVDKTLPAALESRLSRCLEPAGLAAEVLNFGVSGYGTAQELLAFRHHASKYRPRVVILAVYTGNDIFNNHRALNPTSYPDQSPYFTLRGDQLELDASFRDVLAASSRQPWWRRLRMLVTDHVRIAQLLYEGWGQLRPYLDASGAGEPDDERENLADEIYRPPVTADIADAWRVTEALMLTLFREVTATGAEFWIVTLANRDQIDPDLEARWAYEQSLGVDSLFYPDRRIRSFAEHHGIPVITLAEPLAEYAAARGVHLNGGYNTRFPMGTGHINEDGNRVAAEMAGDRLCAGSGTLRRSER